MQKTRLLILLLLPSLLFAQKPRNLGCRHCKPIPQNEVEGLLSINVADYISQGTAVVADETFDQVPNSSQWQLQTHLQAEYLKEMAEGQVRWTDSIQPNFIENGSLRLKIEKRMVNGKIQWVNAAMNTFGADKFGGAFDHGHFQVDVKTPNHAGFSMSVWLFGWAGEVDMLEMNGCDATRYQTNVHNGGYQENHKNHPDWIQLPYSQADAWHNHSLDWNMDSLVWKIDQNTVRVMHRYYEKKRGKWRPLNTSEVQNKLRAGKKVYKNVLFCNLNQRMDFFLSAYIYETNEKKCGLMTTFDANGPTSANVYFDNLRITQNAKIEETIQGPDTIQLDSKNNYVLPYDANPKPEAITTSNGLALTRYALGNSNTKPFNPKDPKNRPSATFQATATGWHTIRIPLASNHSAYNFPRYAEKRVFVKP